MQAPLTKTSFNKQATHPLQTWEWGEFREEWGNTVVRFPFGQMTVHKLPYTPFSVAVFEKGSTVTKVMLSALKKYAQEHRILVVKLEPNIRDNKKDTKVLKEAGAIAGKTLFTPTTFWIDISKSEEELLASFHQKTRYNIRLAEKRGVTVVEDNSDEAFETYWELMKETTVRQKFYAHTKRYHTLMWKHLHKAKIAHLLHAQYNGETLASWVLFVWKDFLYYPYGASSDKEKQLMAPNLLMWEAIKFGKAHKAKTFDLWGREPGKGFTKFKEGYNPEVVTFLGTWDLVCSPLYWGYRAAEFVRWRILRLKKLFK